MLYIIKEPFDFSIGRTSRIFFYFSVRQEHTSYNLSFAKYRNFKSGGFEMCDFKNTYQNFYFFSITINEYFQEKTLTNVI